MSNKVHWSSCDKPVKTLTIYIGSKQKVISEDNENFEKIFSALKNKEPADVIESMLDKALSINKHCKGMFEVRNGVVYVGNETVPDIISKKIIQFMEDDVDVKPLVYFWENLKKNPSYNSRNQLYRFLDANQCPIVDVGEVLTFKFKDGSTKEVDCSGFFVSWKAIRSDYKDIYSGNFDNSPGMCVEMQRSKVNDNPNQTCSDGLHAAAWDYAFNVYGCGSHSNKYVKLYINPEDVVSVPTDYKDQKLRACKYYVVEEVEKPEVTNEEESKLVTSTHEDDEVCPNCDWDFEECVCYYEDEDEDEDEDECCGGSCTNCRCSG